MSTKITKDYCMSKDESTGEKQYRAIMTDPGDPLKRQRILRKRHSTATKAVTWKHRIQERIGKR